MAAPVVDATSAGNTTGTSLTVSHVCSGSDRCLTIGIFSNGTITGVTYNGVAATLIGDANFASNPTYNRYAYRLAAPASGTHDIVVTTSGSAYIEVLAVSWTGVDQTNPINGTPQERENVSSTDLTGTVTTTVDDCRVVMVTGNDIGDPGAGSGTTVVSTSTPQNWGILRSTNGVSAGSNSVIATGTGTWDAITFALAPAIFQQAVGGSVTPTSAVVRAIMKFPAGAITPTSTVARTITRALTALVASAGSLPKAITRALAGAVASSGDLVALRVVFKTLEGAVASTGALLKQTNKLPAGSVAITSVMLRAITRSLTGAVSSLGTAAKQAQRSLSASVASAGTVTSALLYVKALAGSVASSGTLVRAITRSLTGAVAPAGSLVKRTLRALLGALAPSSALAARTITPSSCFVSLGGTDRTSAVRFGSLEVEDVLNDAPNRCTFTCVGFAPSEGLAVRVTRGLSGDVEFVGTIVRVEQVYESIPANVAYHVTCTDPSWKLDRRTVTKRWLSTSATTIAQEIISGFTTGFTSTNVAASLATVADFRCDHERPSSALRRLCAEIGGQFYVDYDLDLHLFITEATSAPDDISDVTLATTTARDLSHAGDNAQIRNRIKGIGVGTSALEFVAVADTLLPVEKADVFDAAAGSCHTPENVGAYTARHLGGVAATVIGNVDGPSGTPAVAVASGVVGVLTGSYKYKVAYANDQGETTPGPESSIVTGTAFAPPTTASVAASGVVGRLVGAYLYVLTYVTALGETSAGSSFGRTAVAVAAPGAASIGAGSTIGKLIGAYNYRITFVTPYGETEGGTVFSRTGVATATPGTPSVAVVDTGVNTDIGVLIGAYGYKITTVDADGESAASVAGTRTAVAQTAPTAPSVDTTASSCNDGPLKPGFDYRWKVAFVAANGNETLGTASSIETPSATVADAPAISGSGTGNSIRCRVAWQSKWGESEWSSFTTDTDHGSTVTVTPTGMPSSCETWVDFNTGSYAGAAPSDYYRHPKVHIGTGGSALDTLTGILATGGAATMGKKANLTSVQVGPAGTVSRRIYRTKGDGSTYFLVGEIGDNSTTTYTDEVHDDALTVLAPLANLNGEKHTISSISTGATGTTKRRIYRTKAGGSTYYLLDEILDNTTTSYTDNKPDSELNLAITAPSASTSGDQHALTFIPTGPSGTTARRIYRTAAGGSIYYLLHTLPDNVTTSYTDNKSDAELGAEAAPTTSTAGGETHSLTLIPTGPTGTLARRLYRTIGGGTSYQFVGELTDNVATSFTDNVADADLAHYVPLVNTAGANKIAVSSIPTGGSSVTKRILYRTEAGGSTFKYVDTINDNSTTTYTDNTPDTSLGREALTQSTIGAVPGDTTLLLSTVTGWPTAGWLKSGSQLIRWSGVSGSFLTGIPGQRGTAITRSGTTATATTTGSHGFATNDIVTISGAAQPEYNGAHKITVTGLTTFTYTVAGAPATPATGTIVVAAVGAILAPIPGGSGVVTAPFLSGVSGLTYPIEKGAPVRLYVVRNDTAAQTALAAVEGGDGIHEATLDDSSIETLTQLTAACDAELAAYSTKLRSITFRSRDPLLRSGKTVTLSLGAPTSLSGSFLIQRVISTEFDTAPGLNPMRQVVAAPVLVSFQDVLRRNRART